MEYYRRLGLGCIRGVPALPEALCFAGIINSATEGFTHKILPAFHLVITGEMRPVSGPTVRFVHNLESG